MSTRSALSSFIPVSSTPEGLRAAIDAALFDAEHARMSGDKERTTLKAHEALALQRALSRLERPRRPTLVGLAPVRPGDAPTPTRAVTPYPTSYSFVSRAS